MMHFSAILLLSLTTASLTYTLSLFDTLRTSAGASKFANLMEGDPTVSAIYLSGVKTVFAPSDDCFQVTNVTFLKGRQASSPTGARFNAFQLSKSTSSISTMQGGQVISTTGGQNVVSAPDQETENPTSRDLHNPRPRSSSAFPRPRIFSGLGNIVNVIRGDIPYDGGLIQVTDGFFTIPQPLSTTLTLTGNTVFSKAVHAANLTSTLEATQNTTIFVPSNAAFLSSNSSRSPDLSYHVLTGFVGYLPFLVHGASLVTRAGTNITVNISGADTFINDARIVHANLVLDNGVAHVLDRVLTPPSTATAPPTVPTLFTSTGSSFSLCEKAKNVIGIWIVALISAIGLFS